MKFSVESRYYCLLDLRVFPLPALSNSDISTLKT